jgi:hypothetical protein
MKNLIQAALVTLFAASAAQAQQAVQWKVSDGGNGHWYQVTTEARYWDVQRQVAIGIGGHLASITSAAENAFVFALLPPANPSAFFIGGVKQSGAWSWVSGEAWGYTNWDAGEPNGVGDQITWIHGPLAPRPATWNDHPAYDYMFRAVFEFDADCNDDGEVDYGQVISGALADHNSNNTPDCCEQGIPCLQCTEYDLNLNSVIDGADLGVLLAFWGPVSTAFPRADINGDGVVNGADLGLVLANWGGCP